MKRILFILFSLIIVASCLDDGSGTTQSYTATANFQYAEVPFASDSTFFNPQSPEGFGYDVLNFYHQLDGGKTKVEGGFILSCLEMPLSGKTEGLKNTYRCYLAPMKDRFPNIYTVYRQNENGSFMPKHDIQFPYKNTGKCSLTGCFVTNTVEVVDSIKAHFKLGDRLSVKAIGYLDDQKTGEVEIALADFSAQKDSIVSLWTPFELKKLGYVDFVDFEVISTNPNVPTYFCMDNMIYNAEMNY